MKTILPPHFIAENGLSFRHNYLNYPISKQDLDKFFESANVDSVSGKYSRNIDVYLTLTLTLTDYLCVKIKYYY